MLPTVTSASATTNPASISGTVVDGQGHPLANIDVYLDPTGQGFSCQSNPGVATDASGNFTLGDVPAGSYRLRFFDPARKYISPSYYPSTTNPANEQNLTVTAGQLDSNLTQTLTLGGSISGIVSGPNGPISNADAYIAPTPADGFLSAFANSGSDGSYTLTGLPTGTYSIELTAPNYLNLAQQTVTASVTAGQPTTGVNATMTTGGTIGGTVTDGGGNGLGNITVFAFPTNNASGLIQSTVTQSSTGNYSLGGLNGNYAVEFWDEFNGTYAYQFSGGGTTRAGATAISVTPPQTVSGVNATMALAGKVAGSVTDGNSHGLSNVLVGPTSFNGGFNPSAQSGPTGSYLLGGLPAGTYKLQYSETDQPLYYYDNTTSSSAATPVSVTAGSTTSGIDEQIPSASGCASSAVGLTSSLNPSIGGQSVTFTATVSDPAVAGTPTGTVSFKDGQYQVIGSAPVNASGQATFTTNLLSVGSHTITANYLGDPSYAPSTSAPLTEQISFNTTSTSLTNSPNPSIAGQQVLLMATVTPGLGSSTSLTGQVTFTSGNTVLGSAGPTSNATQTAGTAQLYVTSLPIGSDPIVATYGGDSLHAGSVSNTVTQTVTKIPSTLGLTTAPNPVLSGSSVTLTAKLSHTGGYTGVFPSGSFIFLDGTTSLGTVPLVVNTQTNTATASLIVSNLSPAGVHQLSASYAGDTNYTAATSNTVAESVKLQPTVNLRSSLNPSYGPEPINLHVSVSGPSGAPAVPTGSVTIFDGGTTFAASDLDSTGQAVIPVSGLSIGTHQLTATYSGDSLYVTATSGSLSQQVVAAPTVSAMDTSVNPGVAGSSITLTANVTSPACPLCGGPSGTVGLARCDGHPPSGA